MRPFNTTREAEDRSPCVRVPIRSAKAREGRHHIDAVRVRHALRKRRGACRIIDKAQAFLEPLDERATHEHAAFERILEPFRARSRGRDGREQAMVRERWLRANIHEHEAPGAEGRFRFPRRKAALAEERRLLIARNPRKWDATWQDVIARSPEIARRRPHFGKHSWRDRKQLAQPPIPFARIDVEEHRTAGRSCSRSHARALG